MAHGEFGPPPGTTVDMQICNCKHLYLWIYFQRSHHISTMAMFFHYWTLLSSTGFYNILHCWIQTFAKHKILISCICPIIRLSKMWKVLALSILQPATKCTGNWFGRFWKILLTVRQANLVKNITSLVETMTLPYICMIISWAVKLNSKIYITHIYSAIKLKAFIKSRNVRLNLLKLIKL